MSQEDKEVVVIENKSPLGAGIAIAGIWIGAGLSSFAGQEVGVTAILCALLATLVLVSH